MKLPEITPVFNLNGYLNKHGESKIHIRIYYKKRKLIATGISISPKQWDDKRHLVRSHRLKDTYNRNIKRLCRQYENNAEKLLLTGRPFTINDILSLHEKIETANISFTDFVKLQIQERKDIQAGTLRNHQVFLNRMTEFSANIEFHDLTYDWLLTFENFLRTYTFKKGNEVRELQLTRIDKYLKTLNANINRAIKSNLMEERYSPFKQFDWGQYRKAVRIANTKRKYLSADAVERIENLEFSDQNQHLQQVRDFFLFQCYTGLAYSDMIRLNADHIQQKTLGEQTGYALKVYRKKSEEPSYIPLYLMDKENKAEKILKRYMQNNRQLIFDQHSVEHINRELKTISEMASISESLSTHVGRHTCAMRLLHQGLSMHQIKQILGQRKVSTTEIYTTMDDRAVEQAFINLGPKE